MVAIGAGLVATLPPAATPATPVRGATCSTTRLVTVGPRLEGMAGSGVSARYANGLRQVSYDPIPPLEASRAGDAVRLCVVSRPRGCPRGDVRGVIYQATNLRTGAKWRAADSSHRCGGA